RGAGRACRTADGVCRTAGPPTGPAERARGLPGGDPLVVRALTMPAFGTSLPGVQRIPARTLPWEAALGGAEMLAGARAAEAAGFAWVSCSDHVAIPASRAAVMGATWYDAGSTLAFVAGATTRIGLLAHVLVLPYRHPLIVAKQYGTLDHLSGGRVILGVGSGHVKAEFAALGADFTRRGRVTDEYLQAIAAAWTDEVARFEGETVAFRDVVVSPPVAQRPRPPIWVGGNSRAALRRAARQAGGGGRGRSGPRIAPPPSPRRGGSAPRQSDPTRSRSSPRSARRPPRRRTRSSPRSPAGGRRVPRRSRSAPARAA